MRALNFKQHLSTKNHMLEVKVKDGENIDRALRRYKKKYRQTKIRDEVNDKRYFTKPSVKRRRQILDAVYKQGLRQEEM